MKPVFARDNSRTLPKLKLLRHQAQTDNAARVSSHAVLSTAGSNRGTAYGQNNIVSTRESIYVAWLDAKAIARIAVYNKLGRKWSASVELSEGTDNHCVPALAMDRKGYLHVVQGAHHGAMKYRMSSGPYDITSWEPVEMFGSAATYPSLVAGTEDTLYCAYRSSATNPWRLRLQSKPKGRPWSESVDIAQAAATGYTQFGNILAMSNNGTIYMALRLCDTYPPMATVAMGIVRSTNGGISWKSLDGDVLTLPVTAAATGFPIRNPSPNQGIGGVVLDSAGTPWFTAIQYTETPRTIILWHHTGGGYETFDLGPSLRAAMPNHDMVGCSFTFDRDDNFYALCSVLPSHAPSGTAGWWGSDSLEVVLMTSIDGLRSFDVLPVSRPNASAANWLPSIERPHSAAPIPDMPAMLYTHGSADPTEIRFLRLIKCSEDLS